MFYTKCGRASVSTRSTAFAQWLNSLPATRFVYQVKAGSIFDNILVCDDPEFAKAEAEKNIVPLMTKEKEEGGWFFGSNSRGQQGFFPASYVELV